MHACKSAKFAKDVNDLRSKMTDILMKPSSEDAEEFIRKGIEKRKVVLVVGNCWVKYEGRASSKLESGERIVIIKEDGSLLVHRSTGYEPVNWMPGGDVVYNVSLKMRKKEDSQSEMTESWQPPGCLVQTRITAGILEIRAVRKKPSESVGVFFDRVFLLSAFSLVDNGQFSLYASEEDMQRAILVDPEIVESGFKPITYEKKIAPGFVDVYGIDKDGKLVVVEIKRKTAGRDAALQLARYVDSVRSMVSREVRGLLVAPRLAKGVQRILVTLKLDFRALDPRRCAEILRRPKTRKLEDFFDRHE